MKKLALILIGIIVAFFVIRFLNNSIVEKLNEKTFNKYVELNLEKDSENRGFADSVKKRIDNKFKEPEVREAFYKQAKLIRAQLLSKKEEEYLTISFKLNQEIRCSSYISEKFGYSLNYEERNSIGFDNEKIYKIFDQKDILYFNSSDLTKKIMEDFSKNHRIWTQEDYEKYCY